MPGLIDMYAQQIAQARQAQYPTVGQRPINSGIVLNDVKPGYGDVASGLGAVLGQTFVKPRLDVMKEEYLNQNDPKRLDAQLKEGWTVWNQLPKEQQDLLYEDPQFQERLKRLSKAPSFQSYVMKFSDGSMAFNVRNKTLEEEQAKQVAPLAESTIATQKTEQTKNIAGAKKDTAEAETGIPATAEYYRQHAKTLKLGEPYIADAALADIENKKADTRYKNRLPATKSEFELLNRQANMQYLKDLTESRKQAVAGYQKTLQAIDNDLVQKVGGKTGLTSSIEKATRVTDATVNLIGSLNREEDPEAARIAKAAGTNAIDHSFGAAVRLLAFEGGGKTLRKKLKSTTVLPWGGIPEISIPGLPGRYIGARANRPEVKDYTEESMTKILFLTRKMQDVIDSTGPVLDLNDYKKFLWVKMQTDPSTIGQRVRYKSYRDLPDSWVVPTMQQYYGIQPQTPGGKK